MDGGLLWIKKPQSDLRVVYDQPRDRFRFERTEKRTSLLGKVLLPEGRIILEEQSPRVQPTRLPLQRFAVFDA